MAITLSLAALMLAIFFSSKLKPTNITKIEKKDISIDLVDQINQVKNNTLVQKLLTYAFIWTCCSTALYFFSLEIINKYTNDIVEQRAIFADADSLVEVSEYKDAIQNDLLEQEAVFADTYQKVRRDLASEIDKGQAEVLREGDKIIVRLAEQGSFDSGRAVIKTTFKPVLDKVGAS